MLKPPSADVYINLYWSTLSLLSIPTDITRKLNNEFPEGLVQIGLVYLIPLHLLELSTVLVIVDLASKTYTRQEEEEPPLTLKEMVHKPFDVTRVIGTLVTFVYAFIISTISLLGLIWLALKEMVHKPFDVTRVIVTLVTFVYAFIISTISLLGLIWLAAIYYVVTKFNYDVLVLVWCLVGFLGLMTMYLGWSAAWNMSVVISILEGRYGTKAMASAIFYSVGNVWRGFRLMLVFFAWEVGLPCIYFGCKGTWSVGILTQIGLFCLGNVVKWVAFTIYFYDCKNREIERKLIMKAKKRAVESG